MSQQTRQTLKRILLNENGQMAIFIALIFQVLFVFFAMVVNIGLVIHDKINLQNSVDLAAYYAAERQAEMLNEIAHLNYAIHQDNKLLAWRLRVMGNFGMVGHPASMPSGTETDTLYSRADNAAVCVSHNGWLERAMTAANENACQNAESPPVPPIPPPIVISPLPINAAIASFIDTLRSNYSGACSDIGPMNWAIAVRFLFYYKTTVRKRKSMIKELRANLNASVKDFRDLNTQSVYEGALKTFLNNLTAANREHYQMEMFNSLGADTACKQGDFWMPEIPIYPVMKFTDGSGGGNSGCDVKNHYHWELPSNAAAAARWDPQGALHWIAAAEPALDDAYHSSRGFEKNPWCMAYVGIKAVTTPRKPFAPLGQAIELDARSFAGPFGGRVGPWVKSRWSPGSPQSDTGDLVDPLSIPRQEPTTTTVPNDPAYIPNYSRFPGDTLGLKSRLALAASRQWLAATPVNPNLLKLSVAWYDEYKNLAATVGVGQETGDALAWDQVNNMAPFIRQAELAAVEPDLFDITYYSIEPDYYRNYFSHVNATTGASRFGTLQPISDIGSRLNVPNLLAIGVKDQILAAFSPGGSGTPGFDPSLNLYWAVRKEEHVLTGWTHETMENYSFPDQAYMHCDHVPNKAANPGNCSAGGRVGYSVRTLAKSYLMSTKHQLGGSGSPPSRIINPPPSTF